jgi:tRNA (guanine37-N1)-methyltransferase
LENRPDLLDKIEVDDEDREILAELRGYKESKR